MIFFHSVRYKNFLATGDYWNEIQLDTGESTLIVGKNGTGKTTMQHAISFALFGKTLRDVNKGLLVNSINQRECLVEIEFTIGPNRYKVVRGIKPTVFEIHQNGDLITQDSQSRDYQKLLEDTILKLNFKAFHQIIVLGSGSYQPFMELPSGHRREVIEDLLDISVFSRMNVVLKRRIESLRDRLAETTSDIRVLEEKLRSERKHLASLREMGSERVAQARTKITSLESEIEKLKTENEGYRKTIDDKMTAASELNLKLVQDQKALSDSLASIKTKISIVVKEAKFYEANSSCPTCSQAITPMLKSERQLSCRIQAKELAQEKKKADEALVELHRKICENDEILRECSKASNQLILNERTERSLRTQIKDLESSTRETAVTDTKVVEDEITALETQLDELNKTRALCYEEGSYNSAAAEMLKDTGVKTQIIRQYLPVMNDLVNRYLETLDFFVSFHLNESFEESIRSRHRDAFTYQCFSEGQKQRIDLALLFTWRQIARMKNSTSTNLLILDETFDSSLDAEGVDCLMKILNTLESGTSVFVISHKQDLLEGKFRNRIEFSLDRNGFSRMTLNSATN